MSTRSNFYWNSALNSEDLSTSSNGSSDDQNALSRVDVIFVGVVWLLILLAVSPVIYKNLSGARNNSAQNQLEDEEQRRIREECQDAIRQAKYENRRAWYAIYLKPFTMVATAEDFFYAKEVETRMSTTPPPSAESGSNLISRKRSDTMSSCETMEEVDEDDEEVEHEGTLHCKSCEAVVHCDKTDDDARLFMNIPLSNEHGITKRAVDAECAICFSNYEVGDSVVYSGLQCRHAFHEDCILQWLEKGKKRCPICRHWFVPGTPIGDQRKEYEARLAQEQQIQAVTSGDISVETTDLESQVSSVADTEASSIDATSEQLADGISIPSGAGVDVDSSKTQG